MSLQRFAPWAIVVLAAAALVWSGHSHRDAGGRALPRDGATARVVRVVDGDTVVVSWGGRRERVRYIGIDTPESVKPGTPVQCYAEAASAANARLVRGREVRLVPDRESRDTYGRLLAYVYRSPDGLFVNRELLRRGYARTLTIAPNTRHAHELADVRNRARRTGAGLWTACGTR